MSHRADPTDLTDAQWVILDPLVPPPKPGGRPPVHLRRELLNAMLSVLRGGSAWRSLPHQFPPWQTVYHSFRLWRDDGTWERIKHRAVRARAGRKAQPSGAIIDSQSTKTAENGGFGAMTAARR